MTQGRDTQGRVAQGPEPAVRLSSGGLTLAFHLARPRAAAGTATPGVVIVHGFPVGQGPGYDPVLTHGELADRVANEMGWHALAYAARGCGASDGDFSLGGWLADLEVAATAMADLPGVSGVWLVGFGTGGALAVTAAARLPWVRGVAAVAAPADFNDWADHPRRLIEHARQLGIIRRLDFPRVVDQWAAPLRQLAAADTAPGMAPRPLLVLHGSNDDLVPVFDARVLADAHGDAELRIIDGGGHQLRHDPRAVAVLLGWLDRQRNVTAAPQPGT